MTEIKDDLKLFAKLFTVEEDLLVSTGVYETMERRLKAIQSEITTYHKREKKESTGWFTIETIETILKTDYDRHGSLRSEKDG